MQDGISAVPFPLDCREIFGAGGFAGSSSSPDITWTTGSWLLGSRGSNDAPRLTPKTITNFETRFEVLSETLNIE